MPSWGNLGDISMGGYIKSNRTVSAGVILALLACLGGHGDATVPYLPDGATNSVVNDKKYFVYEGTYYRPFASDGETIYMVVEDPNVEAGA